MGVFFSSSTEATKDKTKWEEEPIHGNVVVRGGGKSSKTKRRNRKKRGSKTLKKKKSRSIPRQKRKPKSRQKKPQKKKPQKKKTQKKKTPGRAGTGLVATPVSSLVSPFLSGNITSVGIFGKPSMGKNKFFEKADVDIPTAKNPSEYLNDHGVEYWNKYSKELRGAKLKSETGDKLVAILSPTDPRSLHKETDNFFAAIDFSGQKIAKDNFVSKFSSEVFKMPRKYIQNLLSGKDIKSMEKNNPLLPPKKVNFKSSDLASWMMDCIEDSRKPSLWILKVGGDKNKDTIPDISVWMPHGGPGGRGEFETIIF